MTNEGVAETSSLADALKLLLWSRQRAEKILPRYFAAALSRLLQSLQNFGRSLPFQSRRRLSFLSIHLHISSGVRARQVGRRLALFSFWQSSRMPSTGNAAEEFAAAELEQSAGAGWKHNFVHESIDGFQARTGTVGLNSTTRFAP